MARPLKPLIKSGGYYPSRRWTPLIYPGGYTTANGGGQPEPDPEIKTVSGSIVHILDALARPAISLVCQTNPLQDLHGYDSPWPAGGGKNKFSGTIDGEKVSISLSSGTTLTVSVFDANASQYPAKVFFYDSSEQPIDSWGISNNNSGRWSRTFTISFDASYVKFESSNSENPTKPMLEIGSSVSDYSPYSNICPISGRTGCEVSRTGKNLLPIQTITKQGNQYYVGNSSPYDYFFLKAGTYVASNVGTSSYMYWQKKGTSLNNIIHTGASSSGSFTLTEDCEIRLWFYTTDADASFTDIQIELGSTASAYEPYSGTTIPISWATEAGAVYGGTLDVTTGTLTATHGMAVFDGSVDESWTYGSTSTNSRVYSTSLANTIKSVSNCVFNWLKYDNSSATYPPLWCGYVNSFRTLLIGVDSSITSADDWRTYLQSHNLQIVYELAQPQTFQLDPVTVELLAGENNIWCDSGDSELTYYADGRANTQEALGILLGGTYHNPGGADDVPDDEALQILLGGS